MTGSSAMIAMTTMPPMKRDPACAIGAIAAS